MTEFPSSPIENLSGEEGDRRVKKRFVFEAPKGAEFESVYRPFDKLRVPDIVSMLSMVSLSNHRSMGEQKVPGGHGAEPQDPSTSSG